MDQQLPENGSNSYFFFGAGVNLVDSLFAPALAQYGYLPQQLWGRLDYYNNSQNVCYIHGEPIAKNDVIYDFPQDMLCEECQSDKNR